ncbi:MAG: hypothetical protein HYT39_02515 [Candidatus Sungbacteria bacterium]|nr:hypothetical protein [Candidatus Sungbacteria bacterium]
MTNAAHFLKDNLLPHPPVLIALVLFILMVALGLTPGGNLPSPSTLQWTSQTGLGLATPACGSSSAVATCSGGQTSVTFTWADSGNMGVNCAAPLPEEQAACAANTYGTTISITCATTEITANSAVAGTGLACSGSYAWSGASSNTNYSYNVRYKTVNTTIVTNPCRETVCNPKGECACVGVVYGSGPPITYSTGNGHLISSGSFSTPNCAPPTTQCADGSDNDGDGLIDLSDPGCSGSSDNNESSPANPNGYSCNAGSQCQSGSCNSGTCGLPSCTVTFTPSTVNPSATTTLSASSCGAGTYSCTGNIGSGSINGSIQVNPLQTQTCTVTGAGGTGQATVTTQFGPIQNFREVAP